MDMKKAPKPHMEDYDYERKQRREREKTERQLIQATANRELPLFPEPRRVNPSEDHDDIVRKLGDFSKVKDLISLHTVGISNVNHRQVPSNTVITGIVPPNSSSLIGGGGVGPTSNVLLPSSSLSVTSSLSSQRLPALPPPHQQHQQTHSQSQSQSQSHHYQPLQHQVQQQQLSSSRQSLSNNYLKQVDNKSTYNGRMGYGNQSINRSGGGLMTPLKGHNGGSPLLPPPNMPHMPNGRQTAMSSVSMAEKSYLGPPPPALSSTSTATSAQNGRFPPPSIPKIRQKHLPPENDIKNILNLVTDVFCPPKAMLTGIDATPHTTLIENYNLNEPNKHKYSFDISRTTGTVEPLDSPPQSSIDMPAPNFLPPQTSSTCNNNMNNNSNNPKMSMLPSSTSSTSSSTSLLTSMSSCSTYIAPAINNNSTSGNSGHHYQQQQQRHSPLPTNTKAIAPPLSPLVPLSPLLASNKTPTETLQNRKLMKMENQCGSVLESLDKHNASTLENDLELSDSEDDRKKQNCPVLNTSDSSGSDSSESGSEESSKSESHQLVPLSSRSLHLQQRQQHQIAVASNSNSKKKLNSHLLSGGLLNAGCVGGIGGNSSSSSGLGSSAGSSNATPCSSSSSSNKTPSPSNTTKWQLSRYFNKAHLPPTSNQEVVSPSTAATTVVNSVSSMNMATLNIPTVLPGGAQIIPEPLQQFANIKDERLVEDTHNNDNDDDNDDNNHGGENVKRIIENGNKTRRKTDAIYPHHASLAAAAASFPTRKPPAGLSVTPLSPLLSDIKKEAADVRAAASVTDYVSVPNNQIKHESIAIAGGHTTVTPYSSDTKSNSKNHSNDYGEIEGLSGLSSDTDTCEEDTRERLPVPGPGGTLQIPGVPAAITALPRSPSVSQKQHHHQQQQQPPNTLTVTPIGLLPPTTRLTQHQQQQQRTKKPRKKLKQSQATAADTSDEEDNNANRPGSHLVESPASVNQPKVAKKGRGRPRKIATPNQSENFSSASSASASVKGPILTAKKDISKKLMDGTVALASRHRLPRQSYGFSEGRPTKNLLSRHNADLKTMTPTPLPKAGPNEIITKDNSSSSTDSSTESNTSSISESEEETTAYKKQQQVQPTISVHSSSDDNDMSRMNLGSTKASGNVKLPTNVNVDDLAKRPNSGPRRIVKQLNPRKTTVVEDMTFSKALPNITNSMSMSLSSSSSTDSSAEDYMPTNVGTASTASTTVVSTSHHNLTTECNSSGVTTNHLSPYKITTTTTLRPSSSSRSRKLPSCSSAFSSESSKDDDDDDDNSDSDCVQAAPTTTTNHKDKKLRRDKPKSDKNKISTLTRIFKTSNDGGAKKQGQVVIVDQSEEQVQQPQPQKYISPALRASQENLLFSGHLTPSSQSPRLTPGGHIRSPRSIPSSQVQMLSAQSTPDRAVSSNMERRLQQRIKTPTRTPTRTPPTTRTPTPTPASTVNTHQTAVIQQLICKIDLSRLLRIPPEWHNNTYRLYGPNSVRTPTTSYHDHESILNADLQSTTAHLRLKNHSSSGARSGTPVPTASSALERDRICSREKLHEAKTITVNNKQRLVAGTNNNPSNTGRSNKSPSDRLLLPPPPNGYTSKSHIAKAINTMDSPSKGGVKPLLITGVKHEHNIKYEPDSETYEAKYKVGATGGDETNPLIKQELFVLKQDYKLNDLTLMTEKQRLSPRDSQLETKLKRKRATSSPYKEKKRKKDKELLIGSVMLMTDKEKLLNKTLTPLRESAATVTKERELTNQTYTSKDQFGDDHSTLLTKGSATAPNQIIQPVDQQMPPTNHDRQHIQQQHQQQQQLERVNSARSTANPVHLQKQTINSIKENVSNASVIMPPPTSAGPLSIAAATTNTATATSNATMIAHHNHNNSRLENATLINPMNTMLPPQLSCESLTTAAEGYGNASRLQQSNAKHVVCSTCLNGATAISQVQPPPQVIYRSYFERDEDGFNEDFRNDSQYMKEAIDRKHAADRETNCFKQLTLYLEAVIYFLVSGAAMEQHSRSEEAAWTMYRDTLSLIRFISSKFRHMQVSSASQHETNNKVAILSLRCQSLITLKLYKLRRGFCRQINQTCTDYFKPSKKESVNGNCNEVTNGRPSIDMSNGRGVNDTGINNNRGGDMENMPSSISPSNSAGSHSSGANTPPSKIVPLDIHSALQQQHQYFNYLTNSHDLWDQADRLVRQGNHTNFFIALDHENGPLTLHSSVFEVFRYVQAGLAKLKEEMSTHSNESDNENGTMQ